jgi:hypothetical protein
MQRTARQSRNRDEDPAWVCGRPALVLYPVVDPRITKGDERSHGGRRLRDLTRVVVVLLGTIGLCARNIGTQLHV